MPALVISRDEVRFGHECAICLEKPGENNKQWVYHTGGYNHPMHSECYAANIAANPSNPTCPTCRAPLATRQIVQLPSNPSVNRSSSQQSNPFLAANPSYFDFFRHIKEILSDDLTYIRSGNVAGLGLSVYSIWMNQRGADLICALFFLCQIPWCASSFSIRNIIESIKGKNCVANGGLVCNMIIYLPRFEDGDLISVLKSIFLRTISLIPMFFFFNMRPNTFYKLNKYILHPIAAFIHTAALTHIFFTGISFLFISSK